MVPSGVELASATVRLVIGMLPRRYDRCSDATAPARSPGRGPVGRVDAQRFGTDGIAEVQPEPGVPRAPVGAAVRLHERRHLLEHGRDGDRWAPRPQRQHDVSIGHRAGIHAQSGSQRPGGSRIAGR